MINQSKKDIKISWDYLFKADPSVTIWVEAVYFPLVYGMHQLRTYPN
jgi:hypothetical protein